MADLEEENAILKKLYTSSQTHEIRYQFICDNSYEFHVEKMCMVLDEIFDQYLLQAYVYSL